MMKTRMLVVVLSAFACVLPAAGEGPDALDETLTLVGLERADLGWAPKGWWARFPADIPYKLRAFDTLFNEPLDSITFTRSLAEAVRVHLDPAVMNEPQERGTTHLYQAVHLLGINPKFGGMRGYTANLISKETPLDEAILAIYEAADRTTYPFTFYMELPYPKYAELLKEQMQVVPEPVRPIIGKLIMNIIDARRWVDLAFRKVDGNDRLAVTRRFNLGEEQVDAWDYCPQFDDVARTWDEPSLWYAAEKCVQALDDARLALLEIGEVPEFSFDWETPWGWIRLRGRGMDFVDGTGSFLIVDLDGNDIYTGEVASSNAHRPIGLLLDCGGNDSYRSDTPAQGAGLCGIGVLLDAQGNDRYQGRHYAQGVGQFGFGLCADLGGDDRYALQFSGQGCAYFGVGLLLDSSGNDSYQLWADGQGVGGVSGVGVLADRMGDDFYEAVRDSNVTGRPSYHSPGDDVSVNNAQGCAMGRRGDGADGHSWAGGLGALLDSEGNDRYLSGNWTMGTGYWFGIGILHDGAGDDKYRGVCYSQATGAHFCIGVLVDEAGNDVHMSEVNSHSSLAWGHDFSISLLLNIGGDDFYSIKQNGMSYSINRSVTALIDIGGDDVYTGKAGNRPGMTEFGERFRARGGVSDYFADTTSLGLFLDVGGEDQYRTHPSTPKEEQAEAEAEAKEPPPPFGGADNTVWRDEQGSDNVKERNFAIGVDRADGHVQFRPRPVKVPSGGR
jgi:hypothetical protein